MAYSQSWNEANPVGSIVLASDIDLEFRNLKRDLRERLNSAFVDWTTDPVLPRSDPIFSHNTLTSTGTAGSEQTLQTFSLPAGRLGSAGYLRITVLYNIVDNGGTKRFRIKLATTDFFDFTYGAGQALNGYLNLIIANKNSAASQVGDGFYTANGGTITFATRKTGTVDTTVAQNIVFTGEVSVNGDAVQTELILVEAIQAVEV